MEESLSAVSKFFSASRPPDGFFKSPVCIFLSGMTGDRTEAILTAFILTALLAFPTASQNVDFGSDSTPIVSDASSLQTDVDIDPEDVTEASIKESDSLYTVKETPYQRVEKISTPEASLTLTVNNNSRLYRLESASGTLVEGLEEGLKVSRFEGANRTRLEKKFSELKSDMEAFSDRVQDEMTPDVEVRITRSKAADEDERAVVDNDEGREVSLTGWTLKNSDVDSYNFSDLALGPGDTVFVYAAEEASLNVSEDDADNYVYGTGVDWDETEDRAVLENSDGVVIDEDSH